MTCKNCIHECVCMYDNRDCMYDEGTDYCSFYEEERPHGEWRYLKECITDMCNAEGKLNQKQTCQFILNLMGVIEREVE